MDDHQLINQSSGKVEFYTPQPIIEAARETMGGIDLDPASSAVANERVKATRFFDHQEDGMHTPWFGRIFLNHPFGKVESACQPDCQRRQKNPRHECHDYDYYGNAAWIDRLVEEYQRIPVDSACCLTFAATSEGWFTPLLRRPQCFLVPRTNYILPDGRTMKGCTKGSVVTYFGQDVERFARCFAHLGVVKGVL